MPTTVKLDAWKIYCSNGTYDFYVKKCYDCGWYVRAIVKGTAILGTQASFTTRKAALCCARSWAVWMD